MEKDLEDPKAKKNNNAMVEEVKHHLQANLKLINQIEKLNRKLKKEEQKNIEESLKKIKYLEIIKRMNF